MPLITSRLTLLRVTIVLILPVILLACDPDAPPATLTSEEATPTSMVAQTSAETDREALVALYNATDGENWERNDNWLTDAPIGEWYGVTTDDNGRVTSLNLFDMGLSGKLPRELGSLSNLETLLLSRNGLSGEIPPELGSLANLYVLNLSENQLSGEVPSELGQLSNLESLVLSYNRLRCVPANLQDRLDTESSNLGDLPFCVSNVSAETDAETDREALVALYNATDGPNWANNENWLSDAPIGEWYGVRTDDNGRVTWLFLYENRLSGEIPPELGNLANLETLGLSNNRLSGEIPPELGSLANLEDLSLRGNELSGEIPSELGNLANLEDLSLPRAHRSQLGGCVPTSLQDQLFNPVGPPFCASAPETDREALVALYNATDGPNWANENYWLSGASIGEWSGVTTDDNGRVTWLYLSENRLSGEIPPELGSLSNLESLELAQNRLSGEIPLELGNLANLEEMYLWVNQLSGEIPPELGNLSNLESLFLSDNRLSGEIPSELSSLSSLNQLRLNNNELSGEIPSELGRLSNLESLVLSDNELMGCVPSSLQDRLIMAFSDLGGLPFCGAEPASTTTPISTATFSETDRVALVALYNPTDGPNWANNYNWLSDAPIGEWHGVTTAPSGRVVELYLRDNGLNGEIPSELGDLTHLTRLVLTINRLSGDIPSELGNLFNLETLFLSRNGLSGEIPSELGSLSNLIYLSLLDNSLSGEIPSELGSLSNLTLLDLGDNELSGEIPSELSSLSSLEELWLNNNDLSGCIPGALQGQLNVERSNLGDLPFCG